MNKPKKQKNKHYSTKDVDVFECVVCGSEIKLLEPSLESGEYNLQSQMWNDGLVSEVSAGYGSKFDGDVFYLGICDKCIKEKLEQARMLYISNYMGFDDKDYILEVNKNFHRKLKLKKIIENNED